MANPQRENGHIDIANEIADHLAKIRIPGQEMQILWVIFRKTWGWQKKMDTISHTQFAKATGIERRHIGGLLENLLKKRIITKKRDSYICKYGIQKDWEKWKLSLKRVTSENIKAQSSPLKQIIKEIIAENDDKNYTGRTCFICGFEEYTTESLIGKDSSEYTSEIMVKINKGLLHRHHIEWKYIKNRSKSDKSSKIINICFECHRKIHRGIIKNSDIVNYHEKMVSSITKKSDETITKKSDHNRKKENYTKEINIQNEHPSEPKNQEQEIDNLITLYKEKFPAHIKRFGLSAIMKMRDTIDSAVMEGAKLKDIAKRISTAKDGTPWKIISENWLSKYKKEKKNYDKLIKRFSN